MLDLAADRGAFVYQSRTPELESSFAKPNARSVDEYAFLWVEEGIEDGNVLSPHEVSGAGYSVHG